MKKRFILDDKGMTKIASIGALIGLLLVVIVGALIYFEVANLDQFEVRTESFSGYTRYTDATHTGSNYTGVTITITNTPLNDANVNISLRNVSSYEAGDTHHGICEDNLFYPEGPGNGWNRSYRTIVISPDPRTITNFTMVNITYSTGETFVEGDSVTPMAVTVLGLAPLIALVVVAGMILAIILTFGRRKRGI